MDALQTSVADLESLLQHFSRVDNDVYISGANLHVDNGTGTRDAPNALGNVIIGYNGIRGGGDDDRSGSHMLVVGDFNNYGSCGGIVVGYANTTSGPYSSVSGGSYSEASGGYSSVSGGTGNEASGEYSSVSGGDLNIASGPYAAVSGGYENIASGFFSSVGGGFGNNASGLRQFLP